MDASLYSLVAVCKIVSYLETLTAFACVNSLTAVSLERSCSFLVASIHSEPVGNPPSPSVSQ